MRRPARDSRSPAHFGSTPGTTDSRNGAASVAVTIASASAPGNGPLRMLDVNARKYVPATGRFVTPDELWKRYLHSSPYAYSLHDPVNMIDPSGYVILPPNISSPNLHRSGSDGGGGYFTEEVHWIFEGLEQATLGYDLYRRVSFGRFVHGGSYGVGGADGSLLGSNNGQSSGGSYGAGGIFQGPDRDASRLNRARLPDGGAPGGGYRPSSNGNSKATRGTSRGRPWRFGPGTRPLPGTRIRPKGIPSSWRVQSTKVEGGTKYVDPTNTRNSVRVMQGNPNSKYPASRLPYVRWQKKNGEALDRKGNVVSPDSDAAHIPIDQFAFDINLFR